MKYLRQGSASEDNQQFTSEVVANIAIFGREVYGTFVAGPGSKIAVWFSNSGEPVGFDVDWPTYQASQDIQATLPIRNVWDRLFTYADSPRELIERNTTRFECGYVDLGVHKRQGNVIQTGCFAHHDGSLPDGDLKYASIETIPLGTQVVEDSSWPVTQLIAAGQEPTSGEAAGLGSPDRRHGRGFFLQSSPRGKEAGGVRTARFLALSQQPQERKSTSGSEIQRTLGLLHGPTLYGVGIDHGGSDISLTTRS
jgi:hypothetical protein